MTNPFADRIDYKEGFSRNSTKPGLCGECGSEFDYTNDEASLFHCARCIDIVKRRCLNCGSMTMLYHSKTGIPLCSLFCWAQYNNGKKLAEEGV